MKTNTTAQTNTAADDSNPVVDYLSQLTLLELAEIGRPTMPPKKPEARFVRCDGDLFVYHVRGKKFHAHQRLEVESLTRAKGATPEDRKASALANAKKLDKMLLREVSYSRKVIAANAVRRIVESLKAAA